MASVFLAGERWDFDVTLQSGIEVWELFPHMLINIAVRTIACSDRGGHAKNRIHGAAYKRL